MVKIRPLREDEVEAAISLVLAGPKRTYFEWKPRVFGDYYLKGCAWDTITLDRLPFATVTVGGCLLGKALFASSGQLQVGPDSNRA